jgi:uncharacterized membrane protein YhaH (DUF805 family)
MNIRYLFTSFEGRIGRKLFWVGTISTIVFFFVLEFVGLFILGFVHDFEGRPSDAQSVLVTLLAAILSLYPLLAITVKRLHDHDISGWFAAFFIVPFLVWFVIEPIVPRDWYILEYVGLLISSVSWIIGVILFIFLGCLRGTEGQIHDSVTRLETGKDNIPISDLSDRELDHFEASYRRAIKTEGGKYSLSEILVEKKRRRPGALGVARSRSENYRTGCGIQ